MNIYVSLTILGIITVGLSTYLPVQLSDNYLSFLLITSSTLLFAGSVCHYQKIGGERM
jgi:hypothetical protein